MHMKTCIHYSIKNLLASYKVCLCFYWCIWINIVQHGCLIVVGFKISWISLGFLSMKIYVLYTWCLIYNVNSALLLDIRTSTCYRYILLCTCSKRSMYSWWTSPCSQSLVYQMYILARLNTLNLHARVHLCGKCECIYKVCVHMHVWNCTVWLMFPGPVTFVNLLWI